MAFSEKIKSIVKRKSHFQCCLCKEIGVEVHHIIPQSENGSDDESNAAPLCPTCHEIYGDNPKKRKLITEARDLWYEICETKFHFDPNLLHEIKTSLNNLPTLDNIYELKEQIISSVNKNNPTIVDLIGKKTEIDNDEIIKVLDIYDVLTFIYHTRSRREDVNYKLILLPNFWGEDGGLDEILKEFIDLFGHTTAVVIANREMDDLGIPENKGLTEPEIVELLSRLSVFMVVLIGCLKGEIEGVLLKNGEIAWQGNKNN